MPCRPRARRAFFAYAHCELTGKKLPSQKLLQLFHVVVGAIHVVVGSGDVSPIESALSLVQLVVQPIHRGQDVAADVESLRLLLAADLLNSGQG
jgi:hypothetical protein